MFYFNFYLGFLLEVILVIPAQSTFVIIFSFPRLLYKVFPLSGIMYVSQMESNVYSSLVKKMFELLDSISCTFWGRLMNKGYLLLFWLFCQDNQLFANLFVDGWLLL